MKAGPDAEDWTWPVPEAAEGCEDAMVSHMFRQRLVDWRRRGLTQVNVIVERSANGPLSAHPFAFLVVLAAVYGRLVLPALMSFGRGDWKAAVGAGTTVARAGGSAADVAWVTPILITFFYIILVLGSVRLMGKRSPVQFLVFETMTVYNMGQVLLNLYQVVAIILEVRRLGLRTWGYEPDSSPEGYALGNLIWLQYHCRQLELVDTFFLVVRKKFQNISALHMYLRILNMWGWFFACRFACGGDTYFPALVNAATQLIQYSYFSISLLHLPSVPVLRRAIVSEVQIANFVICMLYNLFVAINGHIPRFLALLQLFVIGNGLVLYTNFHFEESKRTAAKPVSTQEATAGSSKRVTFSFDSAGWLYVYHFGVAAFLQEHLTPGVTRENVATQTPAGLGFSGSSAGALTALLLASGTPVRDVFEHVLAQHRLCTASPRMMPLFAEEALLKYQFPGAWKVLTGRLRILVTRVLLRPPFLMGEVIDEFEDNESAIQWILASCHIPIVFGILPKFVRGKAYYDGMMWSSLLVPWRGATEDRIIRISAIGSPLGEIRAPLLPLWWALFPPDVRVLRGLFWRGYYDAALWFRSPPREMLSLDALGACGSGRAAAGAASETSGKKLECQAPDAIESSQKKWAAAAALLRRPVPSDGAELPRLCPTTGEEVKSLMSELEAAVSRRFNLAALFTLSSLPVAGIFLLPPRNAILSVFLFVSAAFTWAVV